MEKEVRKLRQDLERYRFLLSANTDARAEAVIRELIAEAGARLREIERSRSYPDARHVKD